MTITEHKALVAAIPEDLKEGDEIEVSDDGKDWSTAIFQCYADFGGLYTVDDFLFAYARRPAAAQKKRLKDEPWPPKAKWRFVNENGTAGYFSGKVKPMRLLREFDCFCTGTLTLRKGYDSTDWQNSLERRPE